MAGFGMGGFGDLMGGGGMGGGRGGGGAFSRGFEEQYHCYPVSFQDKEHLEGGDKILLPSSALDALARQQVEYPMLFEISNQAEGKRTHCGVLEFSAPEGSCYIPYWMMQNLLLEAGSLLTVKNVSLPKATYVKFQPQSVDFLEISNPRAVLETTLRHFSCLTEGDHICIPYNNQKYYFEVKDLKPGEAVGIVETDLNVDFDAPVGYDAAQEAAKAALAKQGGPGSGGGGMQLPALASGKAPKVEAEAIKFVPFAGGGARLDGKEIGHASMDGKGAGGGAEARGGGRRAAAVAAAEARAATAVAAGVGAAGSAPGSALAPAPAPVKQGKGIRVAAGKYSKSKRHQAGAFSGSGKSMS